MCSSIASPLISFFYNYTPPTEIYTLSLHDALPISHEARARVGQALRGPRRQHRDRAQAEETSRRRGEEEREDRKSTRLNSSHANISYAVFCLKKKKNKRNHINRQKNTERMKRTRRR